MIIRPGLRNKTYFFRTMKSQCLFKNVKSTHLAGDLKSETLGAYVEIAGLSVSSKISKSPKYTPPMNYRLYLNLSKVSERLILGGQVTFSLWSAMINIATAVSRSLV